MYFLVKKYAEIYVYECMYRHLIESETFHRFQESLNMFLYYFNFRMIIIFLKITFGQ